MIIAVKHKKGIQFYIDRSSKRFNLYVFTISLLYVYRYNRHAREWTQKYAM